MQERYICTEEFNVQNDYFGYRWGNSIVPVGAVFVLIRRPTPEKKLFKLHLEGDKFENYLYVRKHFFERHFKLCDEPTESD